MNIKSPKSWTNDRTNDSHGLSVAVIEGKTVAEFFAGIGLMRLGLERAGWSVVFANDIAQDKQEMYTRHFRDMKNHFLLGDIHKIAPNSVPTVTLATASFPCNDLSLAGMREGLEGKQSSAYWGFVRILDEMGERKPPIVLLENVAGFLTSHEGRDFQAALLALNRLGYAVDAFMMDAERFVPQSRVRLFVVGVLKPLHGNWDVREASSFYETSLRPKALADFIFMHPKIAWNLMDMPTLPKRELKLSDIIEILSDSSFFWWGQDGKGWIAKSKTKGN